MMMNKYLFLAGLFGLQVLVTFCKWKSDDSIAFTIKNNHANEIINGQVSFSLDALSKIRPDWKMNNVMVFSENKPLKSELVDNDGDGDFDSLLAIVDFKPHEVKKIELAVSQNIPASRTMFKQEQMALIIKKAQGLQVIN